MSQTNAAALRTTYWVFQIGSKLARSACGTKRNTRAARRCAIAGLASAPAPRTPAAALMNVRRSMTARLWRGAQRGGEILERAKGFEPSTPTLARLCSTPELHPRPNPATPDEKAGRSSTYAKREQALQPSRRVPPYGMLGSHAHYSLRSLRLPR